MMSLSNGIMFSLFYFIFLLLGLGWIVFMLILGMKAMRALDIYIKKNE